MVIQDELKSINDIIKDLALFIRQDEVIQPDFAEYIKTIGINTSSSSIQFQAACFNYIFERRLGAQRKSVFEIYIERKADLSEESKTIVEELKNSIASVFEVKRVLRHGFSLYNIVNEKIYEALSLVKMTSFKGIGSGQFVVARVFYHNNSCYLLEISGVLASSKKDEAYRYAVAKIVQEPELVYLDNPEKQKEIEDEVENIYTKFVEFFGTDEVVTTNKFADDLIGLFNDFEESGQKSDFSDKIQLPEKFRFFEVKEFNNSYNNFLENSLGGFSSHEETYDVGIIFDKELGLYAVPFYGTFNKIFEAENINDVENFDKGIEYFLLNDKISANLIKKVASKHKNFMEIVNKVLQNSYRLDDILKKYKNKYLQTKIFSSTTVLYKSKAFSQTLGIIEEAEEKPKLDLTQIDISKIGRNDPCPCGSGKKFKKCCGANL